MLVLLILTFGASVLLVFGISRSFRTWLWSGPVASRDQLAKDAKMMEASIVTDDERRMLRERMKQKLQQEMKL